MTLDTIIADLDVVVTFTDEGAVDAYGSDPLSGGVHIEHVQLRTPNGQLIDITAALTDRQVNALMDDICDGLWAA